ncbi:hypothetical protein ACN4EG_13125 [Alkalinema pantanalense CENA528]|uniref:hypothetical protein n=1 Tax=Alkalinema pantanalense TaxID=1620705 RepID=UPI003D6E6BB1
MDLSQLKWLKNVKPDQGWAYDKLDEMPIPEARIFRLHWRSQDDKANAQQPLKGDLVVLVQSARGTHIVEMLDDVVYENPEKEWGIYRIVKAVWMSRKGVDRWNLPHQKKIFGVEHLPRNGLVHKIPTDGMLQSQYWKDVEGLQGFQQHLRKLLTQIS